MSFQPVRLTRCFPELFGFVLLDPHRLDEYFQGRSRSQNLLERFTTSDDGDRVAQQGIAIPLTDVEPDYCTLVIRPPDASAPQATPQITSTGWVLGTSTGELLLCGLGYLSRWDPDHVAHRRVATPPGWYSAEVNGYRSESEEDVLEFVLTSVPERPPFRARLDETFNLGSRRT